MDRVDLVQIDEGGDVHRAGAARRHGVELVLLEHHVASPADLHALGDVGVLDLSARPFVDALVSDPVLSPPLELVERRLMCLRRRVQLDGTVTSPKLSTPDQMARAIEQRC